MPTWEPLPPADWPCWVEGVVHPFAEARWPLADGGLLFGRAAFTTLPLARGRALFLAEHLARLVDDAAALAIEVSAERLSAALADFGPDLPAAARALRVHVGCHALDGAAHVALLPRPGRPRVALWVAESPWTRSSVPPLAGRKLAARAEFSLARAAAAARGAGEVLVRDGEGRWIGATAACLFVRVGARVHVPGPEHGALAGVARARLLARRRAWGTPFECLEQPAPAGSVPDEIVLVGSVSGVRPASGWWVGGDPIGPSRVLPGAAGALFQALAAVWRAERRVELGRVLASGLG